MFIDLKSIHFREHKTVLIKAIITTDMSEKKLAACFSSFKNIIRDYCQVYEKTHKVSYLEEFVQNKFRLRSIYESDKSFFQVNGADKRVTPQCI